MTFTFRTYVYVNELRQCLMILISALLAIWSRREANPEISKNRRVQSSLERDSIFGLGEQRNLVTYLVALAFPPPGTRNFSISCHPRDLPILVFRESRDTGLISEFPRVRALIKVARIWTIYETFALPDSAWYQFARSVRAKSRSGCYFYCTRDDARAVFITQQRAVTFWTRLSLKQRYKWLEKHLDLYLWIFRDCLDCQSNMSLFKWEINGT